jgi:hypothetical protein
MIFGNGLSSASTAPAGNEARILPTSQLELNSTMDYDPSLVRVERAHWD